MIGQPPPLPKQKLLRAATLLNVCLPGAGLVLLGRRRAGFLLAGTFLGCFLAAMILFLVGYGRYLSIAMSDDLLRGNKLEEVGTVFPQGWLIGLAAAGGIIYVCSAILFARAKRQANSVGGSC
jgi:hypothetical protein